MDQDNPFYTPVINYTEVILDAVPKAPSRLVVQNDTEDGIIYFGDGDLELVCGNCNRIVAHGVEAGQIAGVYLQCKCRWYCRT
jgi:hypothetical protein